MEKIAGSGASSRFYELCLTCIRILSLIMTMVSGIVCACKIGCFGTVHGVCGFIFACLAVYHVWNRRRRFTAMYCDPVSWRQQAVQHVIPLYIALFVSVLVSGIALACGVESPAAFHAGAGMLLCIVAVLHAVLHFNCKICRVKEP